MSPPRVTWPEDPGVDAWLPVDAVAGLAEETAAALAGDDLSQAWFRVARDEELGDIRVVWLAHGNLHLAILRETTSPQRIQLLRQSQVAIDDLLA